MIAIVLILMFIVFIGIIICILYRNNKVLDFRLKIINLEYQRSLEAIKQGLYFKHKDLYNKYSYNKMLYSIKPLKLKYWFTEEEIKFIEK